MGEVAKHGRHKIGVQAEPRSLLDAQGEVSQPGRTTMASTLPASLGTKVLSPPHGLPH